MNTIGDRIKEIRRIKNYTQQRLANELGLKQNTIATYEMNKTTPSDRTILDICKKLGISEEWLRSGKGNMEMPRDRNEEIESFMGAIMHDEESDFRKRLVTVLSKLDAAEWELLEKMALKLAAEAKPESLTREYYLSPFSEQPRSQMPLSSPTMIPGTDGPVEVSFPDSNNQDNP